MPKNRIFKPISREDFAEAWRNRRISHLHFDAAATESKKPQDFPINALPQLQAMAKRFRAELKEVSQPSPVRTQFCKAAGLSERQFESWLKKSLRPAHFMYDIMAAYNKGKNPRIYFSVGMSRHRYYAVNSAPD